MPRRDVLQPWRYPRGILLAAIFFAAGAVRSFPVPPKPAATPNAVQSSAVAKEPSAFPPLYQRILNPEATAGLGVSMISGVGDLDHAPGPPPAQSFRRPSLQPPCAVPPAPTALRRFAIFEWMTLQQASALGLAVASSTAPAGNIGLPNLLVWRSGRLAECESPSGKARVVYGSEWDVGLLVEERNAVTKPATFAALQRAAAPLWVLGFASSTSGLAKNAALLAALHNLASDVEISRSARLGGRFLTDFAQARAAGDAAVEQAGALEPIGYIAN